MNKKVLTLSVALLLAGSLTAVAQKNINGAVTYRSNVTTSAALNDDVNYTDLSVVSSINQDYYYQLAVSSDSVLVAKRDYASGKVYLVVEPADEAALTNSLWKIKVTDRAVSGRVYSFINKETGYEFAYDHETALTLAEFNAINEGQSLTDKELFANADATSGCISNWAWYTTEEDNAEDGLDFKRIYSYYHAQTDNVLILATKVVSVKGDDKTVVFPVTLTKAEASDYVQKVDNEVLEIKPVVAGAQVLSAAAINSMIDANGSYLKFTESDYTDAKPKQDATTGKASKFTVCKPGTYEAMTFAAGANPFADATFKAEESKNTTVTEGNYAGYNILLSVSGKEYLYVSEKTYENLASAGLYHGVKVTTAPYRDLNEGVVNKYENYTEAKAHDIDALSARYHWKVTYYPTQDSVVFEPLNAARITSIQQQFDLADGEASLENVKNEIWDEASDWLNTVNEGTESNLTDGGNAGSKKAAGVPVALYAMNIPTSNAGDVAAYMTVGYADGEKGTLVNPATAAAAADAQDNNAYVTTYQAKMNMVIRFKHSYDNDYVKATLNPGLYFINLADGTSADKTQTENHIAGAYLVEDMKGHLVYDTQDDAQNFLDMPATQWVVEQLNCTEGDALNTNATPAVAIYNREFNDDAKTPAFFSGQLYQDKDGHYLTLNHRKYTESDKVETVDHHNGTALLPCEDHYTFEDITAKQTQNGYFNENDDAIREKVYKFQHLQDGKADLYLGESNGYVKLADEDNATEFELYRAISWIPTMNKDGKYDFAYMEEMPYGYNNDLVKPLYTGLYKVKVKDENLIDNDHKFLAITNQHKYVIATEAEIADKSKQLTYAVVALKENNDLDGEHAYAIQNSPVLITATDAVSAAKAEDLKGLTLKDGKFSKNGTVYFTASAEQEVYGKMEIENVSLYAKIADLCETTSDVFILRDADRKLYRTLDAEYVNNDNKALVLKTIDEQGGEFLYEDSSSKLAKKNNLNYLAVENKTVNYTNEGFYVDKVAKSTAVMPQYLLAVAVDSVPSYTYCVDGLHGINPDCGHIATMPGYVEGRYLVNFNDSVKNASIDKLSSNANAFLSSNYVRLGFVEALHMGDTLYVMKDGNKLADYKVADASNTSYIAPSFYDAANEGVVYDKVALNGKHNNVAFSFRETGEGDFLIESNDLNNTAQVGSFAGAWIKIHNNVPVLTQYSNTNGNHNTGDTTDSWKQYADYTTVGTMGELINQAARFDSNFKTKDASTTANEAISASDVTVAATTGAVVIKGAAGKSVVITNILGQTLTSTVIASDNATISVPAGIAVVAVEGEEAAKVVVK